MKTIEKPLAITSKHLSKIVEVFQNHGAQLRLVGGVVRDSILGVNSADIDLATDLLPEQVMGLLQSRGIKTIPTGIKFGTVTAIIEKEFFEITTLRLDIESDGRHAKVKYSKDFKEDAARRDFTINALSYCPVNHVVYDYFSGLEDLENREVKFIGTPEERIKEDYLRILRFFRFSCRFAKEIDQKGLQACVKYKDQLSTLSKERIKSEFDLFLPLAGSDRILTIMSEHGILKSALPNAIYEQALHLKAIEIAEKFQTNLALPIIYALLFKNDKNLSLNSLLELKFSRAEARVILNLISLEKIIDDKEELLIHLKELWLDDESYTLYFLYASLIGGDESVIYDLYERLQPFKKPTFPLDGTMLMELGYNGKELGEILSSNKKAWIKSNFALNKEQLINLTKK